MKNASITARPSGAPTDAAGTVNVKTNPDGADVYLDGEFYGNSPATLKLKSGKHTVGVKMTGYKDWSREVSTDAGSDAHLTATLEKN